MKLKNVLCVGTLAFALAACSTPATSDNNSASASTTPSSSASTTEEEVATEGKYEVTNNTGENVKELYFYATGSSDKGENYAADGLADGATTTVDITVDKSEAEGYQMTVEYVTDSGEDVVVFESLHLEEASLYLKSSADVESGATPFSKPE